MEPRLFLQALMTRAGDNPHSLANRLGQKTKQPQLFRFLSGVAKEPRRSTLEPVAAFYGVSVETFYDPELAETAMNNLQAGRPLMQASDTPPVRIKEQPANPVAHLAMALRTFDTAARERAAVLLQGLARDPDGPWAAWLGELLADPPEQQESLPEPQEAAQGITPFKYTKIVQSAAPLRRKKH